MVDGEDAKARWTEVFGKDLERFDPAKADRHGPEAPGVYRIDPF